MGKTKFTGPRTLACDPHLQQADSLGRPGGAANDAGRAATYAIEAGMTVDEFADTGATYLMMAESLPIAAGLFEPARPPVAPDLRPRAPTSTGRAHT